MSVIIMSADSTTLVLNGTGYNDFIEGDFLELAPENPISSHVNGADGSVNISGRIDSGVHVLTVRFLKYSDSDVSLNSQLEAKSLVVFNGTIKENFSKNGTGGVETFILENGSFIDRPTFTTNNQDGNATVEYKIKFRNVIRSL